MLVLSFNVIPYFQMEKSLFFYLITTTSRRHTISLVYYHIKIIVMRLFKIKLNAKVGLKTTQANYCLYQPLFKKNSNFSVKSEVLTRGRISICL